MTNCLFPVRLLSILCRPTFVVCLGWLLVAGVLLEHASLARLRVNGILLSARTSGNLPTQEEDEELVKTSATAARCGRTSRRSRQGQYLPPPRHSHPGTVAVLPIPRAVVTSISTGPNLHFPAGSGIAMRC